MLLGFQKVKAYVGGKIMSANTAHFLIYRLCRIQNQSLSIKQT